MFSPVPGRAETEHQVRAIRRKVNLQAWEPVPDERNGTNPPELRFQTGYPRPGRQTVDLTGGKLEQGDKLRTILSGWVNTVDNLRNEARGSFSIVGVEVLSLNRGPLRIMIGGTHFDVLTMQPAVAQIPGTYRWRFVARCDAEEIAPLLRPNPSLTATQEVLIRPNEGQSPHADD